MKLTPAIIFSSLFAAAFFTVIIILLLPWQFDKYKINYEKQIRKVPGSTYQYQNTDTIADNELFITGVRDGISYVSFREFDTVNIHRGVIHEINWAVPFIKDFNPFFHDYDHDGINEVFLFFIKDTLVVTGVIDMFEKTSGGPFIYVDTIQKFRGKGSPRIRNVVGKDLNKDGKDELIFTLTNTNGVFPRTIYIADFASEEISKGPKTASVLSITDTLTLSNGKNLFLLSTGAAGNCTDTTFKYHDYNSYLMAVNEKLEFEFEPIVNKGFTSNVTSFFYSNDNNSYIISLFKKPTTDKSKNLLRTYSLTGQLLNEKEISKEYITLIKDYSSLRNRLILYGRNKALEIDNNLSIIQEYDNLKLGNIIAFDLDLDGENEFICIDQNEEKLTIYRNNFDFPITTKFNYVTSKPSLSLKYLHNQSSFFAIDLNEFLVIYKYGKNNIYYYKYLIFAGIFIFNLVFLVILLGYNKHKSDQRHNDEKQLLSYQLLALKNQLDPHFALNTLNTIGHLYSNNDKIRANHLFEKYSKLTRETLINSNKISTSLKDEILFVTDYLELEKFRYDNRFSYSITVDDKINSKEVLLPRMLIHTFAENAVKHGLRHIEKNNGRLLIEVNTKESYYQISVVDNGIGREMAKSYASYSTGKGLEIADKMVNLYNRLNNSKIRFSIIDMEQGTKVVVHIPIK